MKSLLSLPLAFSLLFAALTVPLTAQEPVTTGIVQSVDAQTGAMTVLSDQTKKPITFLGTNRAMLVRTRGEPPQFADLKAGMQVTVQYAVRNDQWYVEKVFFGDADIASAPSGISTAAKEAAAAKQGVQAPAALPPVQTVSPAVPVRNRGSSR
jgi:hypothetical protein